MQANAQARQVSDARAKCLYFIFYTHVTQLSCRHNDRVNDEYVEYVALRCLSSVRCVRCVTCVGWKPALRSFNTSYIICTKVVSNKTLYSIAYTIKSIH